MTEFASYTPGTPAVHDTSMTFDDLLGMMNVTRRVTTLAAEQIELALDVLREAPGSSIADQLKRRLDAADDMLMAVTDRQNEESRLADAMRQKTNAEWEASPEGQAWRNRMMREMRGDLQPPVVRFASGAEIPLRQPAITFQKALANMEEHLAHEQEKGITEQEMVARSERTIVHAIILASKVPPTLPDFMRKLKALADFWGATGMPEQMSTIERDVQALIDMVEPFTSARASTEAEITAKIVEAFRGSTAEAASTRASETLEKANGPTWQVAVNRYKQAHTVACATGAAQDVQTNDEKLVEMLATRVPNHAAMLWKIAVIESEGAEERPETWRAIKADLEALAATHA